MGNNPVCGVPELKYQAGLLEDYSSIDLVYVKGEKETPACRGQNKEIIKDDETEHGCGRVHFFKGL